MDGIVDESIVSAYERKYSWPTCLNKESTGPSATALARISSEVTETIAVVSCSNALPSDRSAERQPQPRQR